MSTGLLDSWADAGDEFSAPPEVIANPDGTKTVITSEPTKMVKSQNNPKDKRSKSTRKSTSINCST